MPEIEEGAASASVNSPQMRQRRLNSVLEESCCGRHRKYSMSDDVTIASCKSKFGHVAQKNDDNNKYKDKATT